MPEEVRSKGVGLRSFLTTAERQLGKDGLERLIARLPDDLRNAIAYGQIMASGWYPVSWHRALHQAAQSEARRGASLAREIGRATARDDFRGIYRWVASLLSPETMVKQAARVFGNYFKNARSRPKVASQKTFVVRLSRRTVSVRSS